ncbi:RrF2 family transcriptional regulator [Aquamicrobium segne]|uniref:RrF2 family transcriptional regulator n=1 Tax=Aquamicrobium segne TaxID=469547 RepID=A0ABW0GVT8_9HYPH
MRLTLHTDYALRMLIYAALRPERFCTVSDVAQAYGLSRNHLLKVAQSLREHGFIETIRGRSGGIRLEREPETIGIGALVRLIEDDFALVECMQAQGNQCVISPCCKLQKMLSEALCAWLAVLDTYTLADILHDRDQFRFLLNIETTAA